MTEVQSSQLHLSCCSHRRVWPAVTVSSSLALWPQPRLDLCVYVCVYVCAFLPKGKSGRNGTANSLKL